MLNPFRKARARKVRAGISFGPQGAALAAIGEGASQGRLRLELCGHVPADASGMARMAQLLREHGLAKAPASVVIQREDYELILIETPSVEPAELRAAVRWRVKDMIGFDVDAAQIDVFHLPDQSHRSAARSAYAVAARSEALERYAATMSQATRELDAIDIPELCLRNLCMLTDADRSGVAMLLAGEKSGLLVLAHQGSLYVARHIEWSHAYDVGDAPVGANIDAAALALEVQRSLDYYESHFDRPPIGDLLIAPLQPSLARLVEDLRSAIGLRVSLLDVNTLLECSVHVPLALQSQCVLAIGAALRRGEGT